MAKHYDIDKMPGVIEDITITMNSKTYTVVALTDKVVDVLAATDGDKATSAMMNKTLALLLGAPESDFVGLDVRTKSKAMELITDAINIDMEVPDPKPEPEAN